MADLEFILMHGFELHEDGRLDEEVLVPRLALGLSLYRKALGGYPDLIASIIVAGKYGKRDKEYVERTGTTEAKKMAEFLAGRAVIKEYIFEESEGTNTGVCTQNAYNNIILPRRFARSKDNPIPCAVRVVSNSEHIPRIALQTNKIIVPDKEPYVEVSYHGAPIINPETRAKFIAREKETIKFTLSKDD